MLVAIATGCSQQSSTPKNNVVASKSEVRVLDEAAAIRVAREAVRANDIWVDRATFEAKRDGSGWSVTVWREPRVPGGHRLIKIDEKGSVTAYYRGE